MIFYKAIIGTNSSNRFHTIYLKYDFEGFDLKVDGKSFADNASYTKLQYMYYTDLYSTANTQC